MPDGDLTFASLGVPAPLAAALDSAGITTPFPIQAATLPDALAGHDILGRAKTGSGKTLGFSLPLVARLAGGQTAAGRPRGLVLVPTRELATQVQDVLVPLAHAMGLRVATIFGGTSQRPQVNALRRRTDIVVACPGRLADLIGQGHCDLGDIDITVIDEADQMADLGFLPIVRRLLEATPSDGQRLLFSATLDSAIDVLARRFLTDPARHSVDENSSPAEIEHHLITINPAHRVEVIAALAGGEKRSLVFTRTKRGAERLARQLTSSGIPAAELHGNLPQGARSRNLAAFGSGAVRVMVATDIAARGIHVDGIDLVIHADPPAEHKAYVHRSGRTARGGATGVVVTMQTAAQAREVRTLMQKAGVKPHTATADPDSEVLRDIAGPPVARVTLVTPVTELVKPAGTRAGKPRQRQAGQGKSGQGKLRAGARVAERPARAPRTDRPVRTERSNSRNEWPRRQDESRRRFDEQPHRRFDEPRRGFDEPRRGPDDRRRDEGDGGWARGERTGGYRPDRDRPGRADSDRSRGPERGGSPQRDGRGHDRQQAGARGTGGGTRARSGYSGTRPAVGKRQDSRQGRHF
jgi:superfamily II DNA/RNA helicase